MTLVVADAHVGDVSQDARTETNRVLPSIAVIDDDKGICDLTEMCLRISHKFTETVKYYSGTLALDAWINKGVSVPNIVLIDIAMPEISGFDVIKMLSDHLRAHGLKVPQFILFTAHANPDGTLNVPDYVRTLEQLRSEGYPIVGIIGKPFSVGTLAGNIELLTHHQEP
jgi:CheY-like chemotaxis protein